LRSPRRQRGHDFLNSVGCVAVGRICLGHDRPAQRIELSGFAVALPEFGIPMEAAGEVQGEVIDPTGQKANYWQAPVMLAP